MRIEFERSGGFTGMLVQITIDTDALPAQDAEVLHNLVESANFFDLPEQITPPSPGADQFQYKVTVEEGEQRHKVATSDRAAPDSLQPLLRELTLRARSS